MRRRGQRVFATARKPETLADLEDELLTALPLDVTDEGSIAAAVAQVMEQAGRIDVLINNAGVNAAGPLAELPLESFRRIMETNVTGTLAMVQAVVPIMARQRSGRIVNLGSVVGILATPFAGAYCASKSAVHTLSEALRMEVAPFGIDVVVVQPGGVRSSIADTAGRDIARFARGSLYSAAYSGIEKRTRASQEGPMDTDAFAREVADAVLGERAPRRLRLGTGSRLLPTLARIPGTLRDAALSRRFDLHKLR
jgi:NAD(P)-dependent dehydrogenase (short-subunit alcohol dehydrogenase family)